MVNDADFQVNVRIERPSAELIARFKALKTDIVAGLLPTLQLVDPAIKPLCNREWHIAGPALTVAPAQSDMMMCFAAVGIAEPGDVIVVAAGAEPRQAAWGGGLSLSAKNRGVEAIVVDGLVIDGPSVLKRAVPVFARGSTLLYRHEGRPGSVNVPVAFGGVSVEPGDLVLGSLDGVVIVPRENLVTLIDQAEERAGQIASNAHRLESENCTLFDIYGGRSFISDAGVTWND